VRLPEGMTHSWIWPDDPTPSEPEPPPPPPPSKQPVPPPPKEKADSLRPAEAVDHNPDMERFPHWLRSLVERRRTARDTKS
jgi:hypothetical protein